MSTVRVPRGRRGTAATLTALVAVLALGWGATEAISLAVHQRTFWLAAPDAARFGRNTHLAGDTVLVIGIVALALGLLLLLAALVPARRRLVELAEPDDAIAAGLSRRSLARTVAAAATDVDGVSSARVRGRRRLRIVAATSLRDVDPLPERVRERVTDRLELLGPVPRRTVRVQLDRANDGSR